MIFEKTPEIVAERQDMQRSEYYPY